MILDNISKDEIQLKRFNIILQNVLFNWEKIETGLDYTGILDPNRNPMYETFREMNIEETDKIIRAKCVAFSFYIALYYTIFNILDNDDV